MDRLKLTMVGCGLAALLTTSGCRNLRSEVPPGRSFSSNAGQAPVEFSSAPHPSINPGAPTMPAGTQGMLPGMPPSDSSAQFGTPAPGATDNYGAPTANSYGAPGTSGLATPPASGFDPAAAPASAPAAAAPAPAIPDSVETGLPAPATGP